MQTKEMKGITLANFSGSKHQFNYKRWWNI